MANFKFGRHLTKFLLTKSVFEWVHLLVKNLHFWSDNPRIENLPLTLLLIYKKFSISGLFEDIFVNKVDSGQFAYLVKLWRCCTYPPHLFTISFWIKKSKNEPLISHVDQSAP